MIEEPTNNTSNQNNMQPPPAILSSSLPQSVCKISKISAVDIYRLEKGQDSYIVKAFKPIFKDNYLKETETLAKLEHRNIVKVVEPINENEQFALAHFKKFDIIVMKQALHGDMFSVVAEVGRLNQSISKMLIRQIINAMVHSLEKSVVHPTLSVENLLLDDHHEILVCGWSGSTKVKTKTKSEKQLVHVLGEIAICFLIGTMPFTTKNPQRDEYYKFVNPKKINTFWDLLVKTVRRRYPSFQFTKSFKHFIQDIFFEKSLTFKDILKSQWINEHTLSHAEMKTQFDAMFSQQAKRKLQQSQKKKEYQALSIHQLIVEHQIMEEEMEDPHLQRHDSRSNQVQWFINDCHQCKYQEDKLPQMKEEDAFENGYYELIDQKIKYIIAHLKQFFRKEIKSNFSLFFPGDACQLKNYELSVKENQIQVDLWIKYLRDEDSDEQEKIQVTINLCKQKDKIYGKMAMGQSDLHSFYENSILKCIFERFFSLQRSK